MLRLASLVGPITTSTDVSGIKFVIEAIDGVDVKVIPFLSLT